MDAATVHRGQRPTSQAHVASSRSSPSGSAGQTPTRSSGTAPSCSRPAALVTNEPPPLASLPRSRRAGSQASARPTPSAMSSLSQPSGCRELVLFGAAATSSAASPAPSSSPRSRIPLGSGRLRLGAGEAQPGSIQVMSLISGSDERICCSASVSRANSGVTSTFRRSFRTMGVLGSVKQTNSSSSPS